MERTVELNAAKRRRLAEAASKVREALKLEYPATLDQLKAAVRRLSGAVAEKDGFDTEVEASVVRDGERFRIVLDAWKPDSRMVFSLAHELAHLFLHMKFGRPEWKTVADYVESYARSGYTEEELEANEFAASLLMPEADFRRMVKQKRSPETIATNFGVSKDAVLTRGRWLGLYPWPAR